MRISDWSSDVCSSDLDRGSCRRCADRLAIGPLAGHLALAPARPDVPRNSGGVQEHHSDFKQAPGLNFGRLDYQRSEEHTSELQSLMRISYAVFCLKKKKKSNTQNTTIHEQ